MKTIRRFEIRSSRVKVSDDDVCGEVIKTPYTVADYARRLIGNETQEVFLVFLLNVQNSILGYVEAGRGGIDTCPVDLRQVFRAAVMQGASAIIVCHNHPSGDTTPSQVDILLTRRVSAAADLLGIKLLDHVIVTDDCFTSFVEQGVK